MHGVGRRFRVTWRALPACLALLVGALVTTAAAGEGTPVRLQLKWFHQFQFAGFYAAEAKGFYREAGLAVRIEEGNPKRPVLERVLGGEAEFGVVDAQLLFARMQGKPVVALGVIFQHSPYCLVGRRDSGIRTPSGLADKPVMISAGQGEAELLAMFLREGVARKHLRIVPHSWRNDEVIAGAVAARSAYVTLEPFELRANGVEPFILQPLDYGIDFYGDTLFTTESLVQARPELVAAFRQASMRGWDYAMEHPEEMAAYILTLPGVKERKMTREILMFEADRMQSLVDAKFVPVGQMNPGRWERMAQAYVETGVFTGTYNLKGFLYDAGAPREKAWLRRFIRVLTIAGVLGLAAALWIVQLRHSVRVRTAALSAEVEERRRAETLVREAEQRFRGLIEVSSVGISISDEAGHIEYLNRRFVEMFGYTQVELPDISAWWPRAYPEAEVRQAVMAQWDRVVAEARRQGQPIAPFEATVTCRDGHRCQVEIMGAGIGGKWMFLFNDITERRQLTRELKRRNDELESILHVSSHDLRSPLVNLAGFSARLKQACGCLGALADDPLIPEPLRGQIKALSQEQVPRALHHIVDSTHKMDKLVQGLVNVSRAGRRDLRLETLDMGQMMQSILNVAAYQIQQQVAQVEVRPLPNCLGDRHQINQVFSNLLDNALKYHHPERALQVTISGETKGRDAIYCVADNGIGIAPEHQHSIWQLFYRLDPQGPVTGDGLGLALVQRIVQHHNGRCWVEAEAGKGCRFYVALEAAAAG